jgi:hypothetical protein
MEGRRPGRTEVVPRWIVCAEAEFGEFRPIACDLLRLSMTWLRPSGIYNNVSLASLDDSLAMSPSVCTCPVEIPIYYIAYVYRLGPG